MTIKIIINFLLPMVLCRELDKLNRISFNPETLELTALFAILLLSQSKSALNVTASHDVTPTSTVDWTQQHRT